MNRVVHAGSIGKARFMKHVIRTDKSTKIGGEKERRSLLSTDNSRDAGQQHALTTCNSKTHTLTHTHKHKHTHTYTQTHIYTHTHTRTHTRTHAHTHARTHTLFN